MYIILAEKIGAKTFRFALVTDMDHIKNLLNRLKTGSNTSTVTLRVVGGEEKGSLESGTVKYGHESQGTRTRERLRWGGLATYTKDRPALSLERAPKKTGP
jgi:hypothetical protein